MTAILKAEQITKSFAQAERVLQVLTNVSVEAHKGEWVAILGRSGSGKSTLLNLLAGLDRPDSGSITIDNSDVGRFTRSDMDNFRASRLGLVFQSYHLLPELSALENVMLASLVCGSGGKRRHAADILTRVGLGERLHHVPSQLSGGERQRVAIARALMNDPAILLADEPTGNLDHETRQDILKLFGMLRDEGHTILMVTHDREIATIADRVIHLVDGEIQASHDA